MLPSTNVVHLDIHVICIVCVLYFNWSVDETYFCDTYANKKSESFWIMKVVSISVTCHAPLAKDNATDKTVLSHRTMMQIHVTTSPWRSNNATTTLCECNIEFV